MTLDDISITRRDACKAIAMGTLACAAEEILETGAGAAVTKQPRVSPESVGIDPRAISAFLDAVNARVGGLHSFMLLRRGAVAAEGWWAPYARQYPHMLYSLSKSFTSTAVGLAVSSGHLSVDAPVTSFFPDKLPSVQSDHLKEMQIRHLLSMSTGHHTDALGPTTDAPDGDWVKAFLSLPVQHEPGTYFVYNSAASYMLSAIVQKTVGMPILDYLKPRLFAPLGIDNPTWETCPRGINCGGWGLSVKTEDIARFGLLNLQNGIWAGKVIIPEVWVHEATTRKISNGDPATASDWSQGYCYQFWRCRHNAYRGDGAFGQFCVVMPEQDLVLAVTSGVGDMQAILDSLWDKLLPGVLSSGVTAPGDDTLKSKIAGLEVPYPKGKRTASVARHVSGKTFHLETNGLKLSQISLDFAGGRCSAQLKTQSGSFHLRGGFGSWVRGTGARSKTGGALPGLVSNKTAGRGAWIADDAYELLLCYYETPFIDTFKFKFTGNHLTVTVKSNVAFGATSFQDVVGYMV